VNTIPTYPASTVETISPPGTTAGQHFERFTYDRLEIDELAGVVRCHYRLDEMQFVETIEVGERRNWGPAAHAAARLVFLLAGVSYYKAGAPRTIDLGATPVSAEDRDFLREFYVDGLGEFAFRNGITLDELELVGGSDGVDPAPATWASGRPLVPFGGGIDSLVSVDITSRTFDDVALFVAHRREDRFEAIERAAAATGLPVLRALREVDPQILRPTDSSQFLNGHVPITGILSAIAVLVAILDERDMVVMSNEWSASQGNLEIDGRVINHQFSKSESFEAMFRAAIGRFLTPPLQYFSLLRPRSELWVARYFADLGRFHGVVHSCNRAFYLDASERRTNWCGECDKCCFIDLVLSPFLDRHTLSSIFGGREPLDNPSLLPQFRDLLGIGTGRKPFECVGDIDECRTATVLAAGRFDRDGNQALETLVRELGPAATQARADSERLLAPIGPHWVPDALLVAASLV
jgi:hypothetical protein